LSEEFFWCCWRCSRRSSKERIATTPAGGFDAAGALNLERLLLAAAFDVLKVGSLGQLNKPSLVSIF
jgi:hypothetical protein